MGCRINQGSVCVRFQQGLFRLHVGFSSEKIHEVDVGRCMSSCYCLPLFVCLKKKFGTCYEKNEK